MATDLSKNSPKTSWVKSTITLHHQAKIVQKFWLLLAKRESKMKKVIKNVGVKVCNTLHIMKK
jgi:hypothetical protein